MALCAPLATLPAVAVAWIAGLDRTDYITTEWILNDIGLDNFLKYWRTHRATPTIKRGRSYERRSEEN